MDKAIGAVSSPREVDLRPGAAMTCTLHVYHQTSFCQKCGMDLAEAIEKASAVGDARRAEVSRELALRKRLAERATSPPGASDVS